MSEKVANSSKILDEHGLRSKIVFELIPKRADDTVGCSRANGKIPRLVLQFWDALTGMPKHVQDCIRSWEWLSEAWGVSRPECLDIPSALSRRTESHRG